MKLIFSSAYFSAVATNQHAACYISRPVTRKLQLQPTCEIGVFSLQGDEGSSECANEVLGGFRNLFRLLHFR
jgi:hypothetical protein